MIRATDPENLYIELNLTERGEMAEGGLGMIWGGSGRS